MPFDKLVACTGLWTIFSWVYWFNTTPLRLDVAQPPSWVGLSGVMFATQLVVAVLWLRFGWTGNLSRCDVPVAVVLCACTVSVLAAGLCRTEAIAWPLANTMVGGVCAGLCYLRWALFFARLGVRDAVACLFPAYLASALLKMVVDFVPSVAGALFALALPLVSCVLLVRAMRCLDACPDCDEKGAVVYRRGSYGALARIAACLLVFFVVRQLVMLVVGAQQGRASGAVMSHAIEIALALGVLIWVFLLARSLDFPQLWRFVFLFLASAVLVECASPGNVGGWLLFEVGTSFAWMLLWLLVCDVAHRCDLHPFTVVGIGWGTYTAGNYLGMALSGVFGVESFEGVWGVGLVWALGLATVFLLDAHTPDIQLIFADLHPRVGIEEFATIDERCEGLAAERGLSARELDVLKLLAKGRSRAYMAEELCLSENTVRGHTSRLYAKLGVHTRDELQRLLDL